MSGIIALIKSFIPLAGTVERKILYMAPFLHFYPGLSRGRYQATIASLSLQNRLEAAQDPFIDWIKKDLSQDGIKNPVYLLMQSQLYDLICKVITSAAFYATSQYSLYATLTMLLSQSQRVSKIAQPHLDKMASLPIPRLLKAAEVIAFAPVVIKLIHMALIYVDPKGEKSSLNVLKKTADKAGQGFECLLHLRFSLISLGVSKNLLGCVVSTMYSQAVDYFIKDPQTKLIMQAPLMFKPAYGTESKGLNYFLSILGCTDTSLWPAKGFSLAIKALGSSLFASSDSYDIPLLESLFNQIEAITMDQDAIKQLREDVARAAKEKKIDTAFENRLLDHLRNKVITLCITDADFEKKLSNEDTKKALKTICCPNLYGPQAEEFFNLLVNLSKFEVDVAKLEETSNRVAALRGEGLFNESILSEYVVKKIEEAFSEEKIVEIINNPQSLPQVEKLLNHFSNAPEECQQTINQLKSRFFTKISTLLPTEINEESLSDEDKERQLYNLSTSLLDFAVTLEDKTRAIFYLAYVRTRRFQINLENYLGSELQFLNDKIVLEQRLHSVASELSFAINSITQSEAFHTWHSQNQNSPEFKNFIDDTSALSFLKAYPAIRAEFRFATQELAKKVRDIYNFHGISNEEGWTFEANFPDSDKPQDRFVSTRAIREALH